jgi:hypothetical protein
MHAPFEQGMRLQEAFTTEASHQHTQCLHVCSMAGV